MVYCFADLFVIIRCRFIRPFIIKRVHTVNLLYLYLFCRNQQQRDAERQAFYFEALRIEQQKEDERRRRKEEEDAKVYEFISYFCFIFAFKKMAMLLALQNQFLMPVIFFFFVCLLSASNKWRTSSNDFETWSSASTTST